MKVAVENAAAEEGVSTSAYACVALVDRLLPVGLDVLGQSFARSTGSGEGGAEQMRRATA